MEIPNEAIWKFRRRAIEPEHEVALPAVFVLGDDMHVTARVISSLEPLSILQLRGGARQTRAAEVATTIEHAVERLGARTVVVCAQGAHPPDTCSGGERLLGDCQWLEDHLWLARVFRERSVSVEALYFDVVEGDIYWWCARAKRFELLADTGLAAFVSRLMLRGVDSQNTHP